MASDRLRSGLSFAVICGFTVMLAGTSKNKIAPDGGPITTSTTGLPAPNAIADVDLSAIMPLMTCTPPTPHPGCRLIGDFQMGDGYVDAPTATVVWYGDSVAIGNVANMTHETFFVHFESTPSGVTGAARALIANTPTEKREAADLLAAVKVGRAMPGNPATTFMKSFAPESGLTHLVRTTGKSSTFQEAVPTTWIRKLGNRLIVLEYNGSPFNHGGNTRIATAWISELWLLK